MTTSIYKCFVASPGDTVKEREACEEVFNKINTTLGEQLNFRIESKKWENDVYPSFGDDGQAVINDQILNDYRLFIGIMWNRFGSPTKREDSGTEEEFLHAYNKYVNEDDIEIMMYFNSAAVSSDSLDLEQVVKVREFREKVSDLGGLYKKYDGLAEFKEFLHDHLYKFFVRKMSASSDNPMLKEESAKLKELAEYEATEIILRNRLNSALSMFSNQPIFWIDPIITSGNEISKNTDENRNSKIDLIDLIESPKSSIIKSPPQFGLTCLSHFMVKEAWKKRKLWIYINAEKVKTHKIERNVTSEQDNLQAQDKKIECIVLDSWNRQEPGAIKLLKTLCKTYSDIPIVVMPTIDSSDYREGDKNPKIDREFESLQLLALPRDEIRKVVSAYNNEIPIGDENILLSKVISDLEVLNIHRTPSNCLTLLKVSEKHFDESPVNRTKMLEMVLFVLFDLGDIPTYKAKPDLKDCEYVLGRYCEDLIRNSYYNFTREHFLKEIESFCTDKLIDLEVTVVFDVLFANSILMKKGSEFAFRASYWIYYFAAKRMHTDEKFRNFILLEGRYAAFPEIIEFYTGIDRNRTDALEILTEDIKKTCDIVIDKVGLPNELNPLKLAEWKPSEEAIEKMKTEISDDVVKSKLPDSIKDRHADRTYNQLNPYNQSINALFDEYSLSALMKKIKACSRALRNSDYADPEAKKNLLEEVLKGWEQVSKILFALAPLLASKGSATFQGQHFYLSDDFGATQEERINRIFKANPSNVVRIFKDDLSSEKIGPLLYERINNEEKPLIKHHLILLIIESRPRGWRKVMENYIASVAKNSFYLSDTVGALRTAYRYSFAEEAQLKEMIFLLKMGYAKHEFGENRPGVKTMNKIRNSVIPKREMDN